MSTLSRFPLVKGGRGMFHRTCDAMRTKHPPSPLRKGEIKVSTSILSPKNKGVSFTTHSFILIYDESFLECDIQRYTYYIVLTSIVASNTACSTCCLVIFVE